MSLNYNLYSAQAIFIETNHKRTIKKIPAFNEEEVKSYLINNGFKEPFEITQIPHESPTENQIAYAKDLKIKITPEMTKLDLSYLIDKVLEEEKDANPELIEYATECKIKLSTFIGKKSLYDYIWNSLTGLDKIAFFIFCVYRWLSEDRLGNLNKSPYKDLFYSFAEQQTDNPSFMRSMTRYKGHELRFFGNQKYKSKKEEFECYGGSDQTIAYKTAATFLMDNGLVDKSHKKINFADIEQKRKTIQTSKQTVSPSQKPIDKKTKKIGSIFFGLLAVILWLLGSPKIITIIIIAIFILMLIPTQEGINNSNNSMEIDENDLLILNMLYDDYKNNRVEFIKEFRKQSNHSLTESKKIVDSFCENHKKYEV